MFYFRVPFIYAPKYDFTTSKHWVVQWVSPTHLHKWLGRAFLSQQANVSSLCLTCLNFKEQLNILLNRACSFPFFAWSWKGRYSSHVCRLDLKSQTRQQGFPVELIKPDQFYQRKAFIHQHLQTNLMRLSVNTDISTWYKKKHFIESTCDSY